MILASVVALSLLLYGAQVILFGGKTTSEVDALVKSGATAEDIFLRQPKAVSAPDNPWMGTEDYTVQIVEFVDYQSQYSQQVTATVRDIISEFSNVVKYTHRDFPDQINQDGIKLAELARCAEEQNRFWVTRDRLLLLQGKKSADDLIDEITSSVGLDRDVLQECLDSDRYIDDIEEDYLSGVAAGVKGTPTFFFNGYKAEGLLEAEDFYKILDVLIPGYREYYEEPDSFDSIPDLIPADE